MTVCISPLKDSLVIRGKEGAKGGGGAREGEGEGKRDGAGERPRVKSMAIYVIATTLLSLHICACSGSTMQNWTVNVFLISFLYTVVVPHDARLHTSYSDRRQT